MNPKLRFEIITLFPQFFVSPIQESILGRSVKNNIIEVKTYNLRDFAKDGRGTVDDKPYGGGAGMVLKVDVLVDAVETISKKSKPYIILLDPKGKRFNQTDAEKLSRKKEIALICGHYEGVDQRFTDNWCDEVISIGDYILNGGETAALVIVESVSRLITGSLGNENSVKNESFAKNKTGEGRYLRILDYPVYTRPENFRGKKVPDILLSGDHEKISNWRKSKSIELTRKIRPDLLNSH